VSAPEKLHDIEREFRNLVQTVVDQRWEREGRYSAKEILEDVRDNKANDKLWHLMAEQLAKRAAVSVIQHQMKTRTQTVHPAQQAFAFAGELPVPAITYKRAVVATLRATAEEYLWFAHWSQRRHQGTVRRSKVDKKELAKIERFARIVENNRGDDPNVTIEEIVSKRQERLAAFKKQRKNKKRRAR
jgi:hypothetical protein